MRAETTIILSSFVDTEEKNSGKMVSAEGRKLFDELVDFHENPLTKNFR